MSYSNFEEDKKIFDDWRDFLNEGPPRVPPKAPPRVSRPRGGPDIRRRAVATTSGARGTVNPAALDAPAAVAGAPISTAALEALGGTPALPAPALPATIPGGGPVPAALISPISGEMLPDKIASSALSGENFGASINPPPHLPTSGLPDSPAPSWTPGSTLPDIADPSLPSSLRAIVASQAPIPMKTLEQLSLAIDGRPLPTNLSSTQIQAIRDSFLRTLPGLAATIEREQSIRNMEKAGVVVPAHARRLPSGETVAAQRNQPLATRGPGTETGVRHSNIEKNIDDIMQFTGQEPATMTSPMGSAPSQGQWSFLEPTRQELATGVPRWEGLENVYGHDLNRHANVGRTRQQTMAGETRSSHAVAPRFYGYTQERTIMNAVRDADRSLTTDEIVDLARTSLYAGDPMGYKLVVDMYRHLEAQGKLPYQQVQAQDPLRPWRARNREVIDLDENKLQYIIKDEYQKLLLEIKK